MASKVNLDISERLDITCRRGDTFSLTLTLKDSSGTAKTASTMRNVPSGRYAYDLQEILPSATGPDTHTTILRGVFTVNEDVAKAETPVRPTKVK